MMKRGGEKYDDHEEKKVVIWKKIRRHKCCMYAFNSRALFDHFFWGED